mmetsp:Transcript_9872/g.24403  ORF Transcript_9872/g.24403 Transcript_9872/m.24403 type:complete len:1281 (-) Transcript_9872:278-4120(-)
MAESFQLLTVLGNGSKSVEAHGRYPLGCYQSGSTLVLWDYVKDKKRNVPLLPNQWCHQLFFAKDGLTVLGLWLGQTGQPTLSCWRVADGEKVAEQTLADTSGSGIISTWSPESHTLVVVQRGCVGFASVIHWDARTLRHQKIAHGHIGSTEDVVGIQLLPDERTFVLLTPTELKFFSFATDMSVRLLSRVLFKQPMSDVHVYDDVLYLLSRKGKLLCIDFEGNLLATVGYPGVRFTAVAIGASGGSIAIGSGTGDLYLYSLANLEFKKKIESPMTAAATGSGARSSGAAGGGAAEVYKVTFGMNLDYLFVSFLDSSIGVAHLPTASYVGLRVGHLLPVKKISLAPPLHIPPALAARLVDPDRHAMSNALSFVSLSQDCSFLSWPCQGSPFRTAVFASDAPHEMAGHPSVETFVPSPHLATSSAPRTRIPLTTAAFRVTQNNVALDGRLNGSYEMLAGAADGSLMLYSFDDYRPPPRGAPVQQGYSSAAASASSSSSSSSEKFGWRVRLIRPPGQELREWTQVPAQDQLRGVVGGRRSKFGDVLDDSATGAAEDGLEVIAPPVVAAGAAAFASAAAPSAATSKQMPHCTDLHFLPEGTYKGQSFVLATYSNGFSEMLTYPELQSSLVLHNPDRFRATGSSGAGLGQTTKGGSRFVGHPDKAKRRYDQASLYVLCQTGLAELVLFEVYKLGVGFAKTTYRTFEVGGALDKQLYKTAGERHEADLLGQFSAGAEQAVAGRRGRGEMSNQASITDFVIHPSKLFLVVTAIVPDADAPQLSAFDLWNGGLRHKMPLFASVLISSLAPLRPAVTCDASGAFLFAASTPAWVGSFEQAAQDLRDVPTNTVTDSCQLGRFGAVGAGFGMPGEGGGPAGAAGGPGGAGGSVGGVGGGTTRLPPTASVLCVIDFRRSTLLHQMSLDICALCLGSLCTKIHDPTQLYIGSHDGTISIWAPPESVRRSIRSYLKEAAATSIDQEGSSLEDAVEAYWWYSQRHLPTHWSEESQVPMSMIQGDDVGKDSPLGGGRGGAVDRFRGGIERGSAGGRGNKVPLNTFGNDSSAGLLGGNNGGTQSLIGSSSLNAMIDTGGLMQGAAGVGNIFEDEEEDVVIQAREGRLGGAPSRPAHQSQSAMVPARPLVPDINCASASGARGSGSFAAGLGSGGGAGAGIALGEKSLLYQEDLRNSRNQSMRLRSTGNMDGMFPGNPQQQELSSTGKWIMGPGGAGGSVRGGGGNSIQTAYPELELPSAQLGAEAVDDFEVVEDMFSGFEQFEKKLGVGGGDDSDED